MKEMQEFEQVDRFEGIDVEGIAGSKGWGSGLRTEDDGDCTMVLAKDYDALLAYSKELQKKLDARFHVPTRKLVREAIIAASHASKEQPK